MSTERILSTQQVEQFTRDGYLILPQHVRAEALQELQQVTREQLNLRQPPFELEAEVSYPGAPASQQAAGGQTIRRLLQAYDRHPAYRDWAENLALTAAVQQLLRTKKLYINPNHHNCVMTKQPEFSSQTNWHRDTRYWHFNNKYLINAWLALGDEKAENGGMLILPGSHRWDISAEALDDAQFLLEDHPNNVGRLSLAKQVDLNAGDCLLFSAHCFHAAGANHTQKRKFSLVFTFHGEATHSLPETKSSQAEPIKVL